MIRLRVGVFCAMLGLAGCEAAQSRAIQGTAVGSALGAATGAVVGHHYGETGAGMAVGGSLGGVAGALAGSALQAPPSAPPPSGPAATPVPLTKFCPVGGERYPEAFRYCPLHGIELHEKETPGAH